MKGKALDTLDVLEGEIPEILSQVIELKRKLDSGEQSLTDDETLEELRNITWPLENFVRYMNSAIQHTISTQKAILQET